MAKRKMLLQKIPVHTTKTGMKRTFKLNSKKVLISKKKSRITARTVGDVSPDAERY
jgi:hypothetical protein